MKNANNNVKLKVFLPSFFSISLFLIPSRISVSLSFYYSFSFSLPGYILAVSIDKLLYSFTVVFLSIYLFCLYLSIYVKCAHDEEQCQGLSLNCIVIRDLLVTTELPNDELSSIHTPNLPYLLL